MRKISFLAMAMLLVSLGAIAQTIEEGKRLIRYGRFIQAEEHLQKMLAANPSDPLAIYWLGQLFLNDNPMKLDKAKALYSEGLVKTNQSPLVLVGVGHIELLEHKNAEAKQRFEQAIAATKNKKNKNFGDVSILEAIGRANAMGDSQTGDIEYAMEKLTQASQLDPTNPHVFVDKGLIHLKRGPEYGGEAKRAFEEATDRSPNYGLPYWRIGRIFETQKNSELFLDYYNKSIKADPKFAPGYFSLYQYYQDKDVNKAKEYLDKFIENNERDRETDFFYADYMFRSGKNLESIAKGKEIEAGLKPGESFPKVYKLYALNYDRLGDSVKARDNMEMYINKSDPAVLKGDDYAEMATFYLKFPGMEEKADEQVEKAVKLDSSRENQIKYMQAIANAYARQNGTAGYYKWLKRIFEISPTKAASNYYYLADAAFKAGDFAGSEAVAASYIEKFSDQPQGYYLRKRAAVANDADTTTGTAIPAVDQYIGFMMNDVTTNKNRILESLSYKFYFYLIKSREYDKAVEVAKEILKIDPENAYGKQALAEAERLYKAKQAGKIQ